MERVFNETIPKRESSSRMARILKRVFDIFASGIALFFLLPFLGIIAIAIRKDSEGPVFYGGSRVGRNGKVFKIWKFRTMYEDPKSYRGPRVTAKGDPRITPVGKWLRDTKLNELPQFYNVLKGEMSMVGPRPEDPSFAKTWPIDIKNEVLSMQPGITSPATVVYHDEESILSSNNFLQQYIKEIGPDKLRLDQMYVRNHTFMLDLDILLWTFLILLPRIRSNTPPEELLFVGPLSRLMHRYMNWITFDLIASFSVVGLTGLYWKSISTLDAGFLQYIAMAFVFSLIFSFSGWILGVNRISWSKASPYNVLNLLPAWILATGTSIAINQALEQLPLGLVVLSSIFCLAAFITTRYSRRLFSGVWSYLLRNAGKETKPCERVIILGSGRTAEHVCNLLDHPSNARKFEVVGMVDDDFSTQGMRIYGKKVLGRMKNLDDILEENKVEMLFLASHTMSTAQEDWIAEICIRHQVKAVVIPDIFGSIQTLYEESLDNLEHPDSSHNGYHNIHYACLHCEMLSTKRSNQLENSEVN